MPFFDQVCQEHEFLFVIFRVIVMELQTHILQNCTTQTFNLMTFRKIRFKTIVIDTNCTDMSFHEAVKGHNIPCFTAFLHYVGVARYEHAYTVVYTITKQ